MHILLRPWVAVGVIAFIGITAPMVHARDATAPETFDCVIEPQQAVKLSSAVTGVIREVSVDRGDVVKQGQVLAKLEAAVEEANLALAQAKASSDAPIKSAEAKLEFLRGKHAICRTTLALSCRISASARARPRSRPAHVTASGGIAALGGAAKCRAHARQDAPGNGRAGPSLRQKSGVCRQIGVMRWRDKVVQTRSFVRVRITKMAGERPRDQPALASAWKMPNVFPSVSTK